MTTERLFLDTAFIQALLNPRDDYHNQAKTMFPRIRTAREVWITEAIFAEVGNALSAFNRLGVGSSSSATTPTISKLSASIQSYSCRHSRSINLAPIKPGA